MKRVGICEVRISHILPKDSRLLMFGLVAGFGISSLLAMPAHLRVLMEIIVFLVLSQVLLAITPSFVFFQFSN